MIAKNRMEVLAAVQIKKREAAGMKSYGDRVPTVLIGQRSARRWQIFISYQVNGEPIAVPHPESFKRIRRAV